VGGGSPGSREAEGERGEGFYIAQSSRRADLLVIGRGTELGGRQFNIACPVLAAEPRRLDLTLAHLGRVSPCEP
jgi:hypothetical protein